jgi:hypothetical protein
MIGAGRRREPAAGADVLEQKRDRLVAAIPRDGDKVLATRPDAGRYRARIEQESCHE